MFKSIFLRNKPRVAFANQRYFRGTVCLTHHFAAIHSAGYDLRAGSTEPDAVMSDTPKKLIACCDGTWLNSDSGWKQPSVIPWNPLGHTATPSNVTRISRAIKALDSHGCPQIVYYQRGLGTGWTLDDQILGGALGLGLGENIREGYEFIANNYAMRDVIVLIGFSRGAFTARSIGGMICSLGLLTKEGLSFFYEVFEDWEHTGLKNYKTKASSVIPGFTMTVKPDQPSYLVEYLNELKRVCLCSVVNCFIG